MDVRIEADRTISDVALTGIGDACAFPATTRVDSETLCCVYRQGSDRHSYDGILVCRISRDNGTTWEAPVVVCDLRDHEPPESVMQPQVCSAADGTIIVSFSTVVVAVSATTDLFSPEGIAQERRHYLTRSIDQGASWSFPRPVTGIEGVRACLLGQSVRVRDAEVMIPVSFLDSAGTRVLQVRHSQDAGATLSPPSLLATDGEGVLCYDDPYFTVYGDGTIVGMLWTYRREDEITVDVYRIESGDGGHSWSSPAPVGTLGQISAPLALGETGMIVASNWRSEPAGILLWKSNDRGKNFEEGAIRIWDADRDIVSVVHVSPGKAKGKPVTASLSGFRFGTPSLIDLGDGSIMLTCYVVVGEETQIRSCIFSIEQ